MSPFTRHVERSLHPFVLLHVHITFPFALLEINNSTTDKLARYCRGLCKKQAENEQSDPALSKDSLSSNHA